MPEESSPGPKPSTLDTVDTVPENVPVPKMRITYSTTEVSDWVSIDREGHQITLELADPLLNIVRKLGRANNVRQELEEAIGKISIGGVLTEFLDSVAEFANKFLPVSAFTPEMMGLGLAVYLLSKLHEKGLLMLGHIHQADIAELPSWLGLIEEGKRHPDITVH